MDVKKPKLDMAAVLIESMEQLVDGLNGVPGKMTVRTIEIPDPPSLSRKAIRDLRERLGVSQALFAKLLGVSQKLVEAWEGGTRKPSTMACRLLEAISREPSRYTVRTTRKKLPASLKSPKSPKRRVA